MALKIIRSRPILLKDVRTKYCPRCGHGIATRLMAEAIERLGMQERCFVHWPIGCSVLGYNYCDLPALLGSHGRAASEAIGAKNCFEVMDPENPWLVVTYQGDGDAYAIGAGDILSAAALGACITVIVVSNQNFAMTGGQKSPETLLGQKTQTTPEGRDAALDGYPVDFCRVYKEIPGTVYVARAALIGGYHEIPKGDGTDKKVKKWYLAEAKEFIVRAFQTQLARKGFSLVELLSPCPVSGHFEPEECAGWIKERVIPQFPLGEFKVPDLFPEAYEARHV